MPYSERDTRQELIDRRLALAGWNVADPSQVIQELDIRERMEASIREADHLFDSLAQRAFGNS